MESCHIHSKRSVNHIVLANNNYNEITNNNNQSTEGVKNKSNNETCVVPLR